MDNRISLEEYLSSYRTMAEKRKVFLAISKEMHRFHNDGKRILRFHYRTIGVCFTNPTDIKFASYEKIGKATMEEIMQMKFDNIQTLAIMAIGSFLDSYDYRLPLLSLDVLKENLDTLEHFFHPDDFIYFKRVLFLKEQLYYDDYIQQLEGDDVTVASSGNQAFTNYFLLIINLAVVLLLIGYILLFLS